MKKYLLPLILLVSLNAQAITWKIFDACSEDAIHQGDYSANIEKSVGDISIEIFEQQGFPYIGNAQGINSILNTPIGMDSIEVVSDEEMRVYGWCYLVNGKQPLDMASEVKFNSQDDKLIWFHAYSTNLRNEWIDYCVPANWEKPDMFCKKNK